MKTVIRSIVISILLIAAAPSYADSAVQIYHCSHHDGVSDNQIELLAAEWLAAAKTMPGGENLKVYLRFPVVATMGPYDFAFIVSAPSFEEWGEFTGAYDGSALEDIDDRLDEVASCPDSALYEMEDVG